MNIYLINIITSDTDDGLPTKYHIGYRDTKEEAEKCVKILGQIQGILTPIFIELDNYMLSLNIKTEPWEYTLDILKWKGLRHDEITPEMREERDRLKRVNKEIDHRNWKNQQKRDKAEETKKQEWIDAKCKFLIEEIPDCAKPVIQVMRMYAADEDTRTVYRNFNYGVEEVNELKIGGI